MFNSHDMPCYFPSSSHQPPAQHSTPVRSLSVRTASKNATPLREAPVHILRLKLCSSLGLRPLNAVSCTESFGIRKRRCFRARDAVYAFIYYSIDLKLVAPGPPALVAQLVERKAFNLVVMGSSPIQGAENCRLISGVLREFLCSPPCIAQNGIFRQSPYTAQYGIFYFSYFGWQTFFL